MIPKQKAAFAAIIRVLEEYPEGIAEFQMLKRLSKEGVGLYRENEFFDDLSLFRIHFIFFHLLYQLRDKLFQEKKGLLEIHCLKIRLMPFETSASMQLDLADPLREYYLDFENLTKTGEREVEGMLDDFWKRFERYENNSDALQVLGLNDAKDRKRIKARYRELAHEHHPDKGGDPERFVKIQEAAESLLKTNRNN